MEFNKDETYSKSSFFWIPTFYDKKRELYFCKPKNKEFVSKFYQKEYWDKFSRWKKYWITHKLLNIINNLFYIFNLLELKYISDFKIIQKYFKIDKNTKILEIWSWKWILIKYFKNKWININWVELDQKYTNNINSKLWNIVYYWNYEEITINKKYDLIYLRHVLEHFINLDKFFTNLDNNLNENWIVYINVPNWWSKYFRDDSLKIIHTYIILQKNH